MTEAKLSAEEFMRQIGVKCLKELTSEFVGRWVPVKEALPPERYGVLLARNNLDHAMFGYLRYAAGDEWSPMFVCPGYAGLEERGALWEDANGDKLIATTHWFSPSLEGLPIVTAGLYSDLGLGSVEGDCKRGYCWWDTSEYTAKSRDEMFRSKMRSPQNNSEG